MPLLTILALLSMSGDAPSTRTADDFASTTARHIARLERRLANIDAAVARSTSSSERDWLQIDKLRTTFELATIRDDSLDSVDRLAAQLLEGRPSPELSTAADYWRLRVALARFDPAPASQPVIALRIRRVDEYLDQHPGASFGPALIAEVVESAYEGRDFVSVDRLLNRLKREYPDDPTTAALVGQDRVRRCIGEPWAPVLKDARGADVELARLRGEPAMVLFFASWDPLSRELLGKLGGWASLRDPARPRLVAISLDAHVADAETALKNAGLSAVLCCEERGWSSPVANAWGIRALPVVLLLDGDGKVRHVFREVGPETAAALGRSWRAVGGRLE